MGRCEFDIIVINISKFHCIVLNFEIIKIICDFKGTLLRIFRGKYISSNITNIWTTNRELHSTLQIWCQSNNFVKDFVILINPSFYTTLTSLINKLVNATPNNGPHTTLINNRIDINTWKWWINFSGSSYFTKIILNEILEHLTSLQKSKTAHHKINIKWIWASLWLSKRKEKVCEDWKKKIGIKNIQISDKWIN